jgi:rhodanese-related sulfurtransferase
MNKVIKIFTVILAVVFAGGVMAAKPVVPEKVDGVNIVDTAFINQNIGKMPIYDNRKKAEYVDAHLPGAIHAEYKEKTPKSVDFDGSKDKFKGLKHITTNKSEAIIVYCNGPRCWRSYKAAVTLRDMGYTNVNWYRDGFPVWKKLGS